METISKGKLRNGQVVVMDCEVSGQQILFMVAIEWEIMVNNRKEDGDVENSLGQLISLKQEKKKQKKDIEEIINWVSMLLR